MFATFFFGIGSMLIFAMTSTMLTEFSAHNATKGIALAIIMRNTLGCVGAIIATPLIDAIGNGWLFTILALVSYASAFVIVAIRVWGPRWRKSMERQAI